MCSKKGLTFISKNGMLSMEGSAPRIRLGGLIIQNTKEKFLFTEKKSAEENELSVSLQTHPQNTSSC